MAVATMSSGPLSVRCRMPVRPALRVGQRGAVARAPFPRRARTHAPPTVCAAASKPPSYATASTELEALSRVTCVVADSVLSDLEGGAKPKAATVNSSFILGVMKSTYGQAQFKNCLAGAAAYDKSKSLQGIDRTACQIDKAMTNIGSVLADRVEGRVSTEVDPRVAYDTDAIIARTRALKAMYDEVKVPASKVLYAIPCTWEGIQAAKKLEADGIQCHMVHCFSFVQAVAAAQAGASVIQVNVGRIDDWYKKNPGFIRDPTGPRQDAGLVSDVDPGVVLMKKIYMYSKKYHPGSQLMASGLRSKAQALNLAGLEYMVVSPPVLESLENSSTLSGFNDGLRADVSGDDILISLSPEMAKAANIPKLDTVTQPEFIDGLGYLGFDLLKTALEGASSNIERCEPFFQSSVGGQE